MADEPLWDQAGDWVWENKERVAKHLKHLFKWFRSRPETTKDQDTPGEQPGILMIGAGGVGKSTFARILSGEYNWLLDVPGEYEESISVERYEHPQGSDIIVLPGQQHRRKPTWQTPMEQLAGGDIRGIIVFSAYGFHSLGAAGYRSHRLYLESQKRKPAFLRAYLELQREEELQILREMVPIIQHSPSRLWMLSVVTKQDLWWPDHPIVNRHYRDGEYSRMINEIRNGREDDQFRHELALASLVISNFPSGVGDRREVLLKNRAGYDQPMQVQSLRRVIETLDSLRRWESET